MKIIFLIASFLINLNITADVINNVLEQYPNDIFICTGIGNGDIIEQAIAVNCRKNAFFEIYAVEGDSILAEHSQNHIIAKFIAYQKPKKLKACQVYFKNPVQELAEVISHFSKPITFVLASQFPDWVNPEKDNLILQELDQIKKHPIKNHTILIDYIYFGNIDLEVVKNKLLEINAHYKFKFENGGHLGKEKDAVLVAYLS